MNGPMLEIHVHNPSHSDDKMKASDINAGNTTSGSTVSEQDENAREIHSYSQLHFSCLHARVVKSMRNV